MQIISLQKILFEPLIISYPFSVFRMEFTLKLNINLSSIELAIFEIKLESPLGKLNELIFPFWSRLDLKIPFIILP